MQLTATATTTSEFLESLANQARANGLDTNAVVYEQRALQAKQLEIDHAHLQQLHQGTQTALDDLRSRIRTLEA